MTAINMSSGHVDKGLEPFSIPIQLAATALGSILWLGCLICIIRFLRSVAAAFAEHSLASVHVVPRLFSHILHSSGGLSRHHDAGSPIGRCGLSES